MVYLFLIWKLGIQCSLITNLFLLCMSLKLALHPATALFSSTFIKKIFTNPEITYWAHPRWAGFAVPGNLYSDPKHCEHIKNQAHKMCSSALVKWIHPSSQASVQESRVKVEERQIAGFFWNVKRMLEIWSGYSENERNRYFSQIIVLNCHNPRVLFNTISSTLNNPEASADTCNQFLSFFVNKVESIRSAIVLPTCDPSVFIPWL